MTGVTPIKKTENQTWQEKFIARLSKTGVVTVSARFAKISRKTAYLHRAEDDNFAGLWEDALAESADLLEEEARRRAYTGVVTPKTIAGEAVNVREYSDTLLIFLLKGAKPDKFRERREISGPGGGAVRIKLEFDDLRKLDPVELLRLHSQTLGDTPPDRG